MLSQIISNLAPRLEDKAFAQRDNTFLRTEDSGLIIDWFQKQPRVHKIKMLVTSHSYSIVWNIA